MLNREICKLGCKCNEMAVVISERRVIDQNCSVQLALKLYTKCVSKK